MNIEFRNFVFYIYAPRWTDASAGIRSLHYLCHQLNGIGMASYLILSNSTSKNSSDTSPILQTPVLTQELLESHKKMGKFPITFYSETVPGNPLRAPFVVRYLMNYVGSLGGMNSFHSKEQILAYSHNIAVDYAMKNNCLTPEVLFLPAVDPKEFSFQLDKRENFYLLYAGKYRAFIGKPQVPEDRKFIEIKRTGHSAQNRHEVIELLSKCRGVISFENSSIITEAVLSGCPGIFVPNPFLREAIASVELGWDGTAWGLSAEEEERARSTLQMGRDRYLNLVSDFPKTLESYCQNLLSLIEPQADWGEFLVPRNFGIFSRHRVELATQIFKNLGFFALLKVVSNFVRRRMSRRF
jgi:hypothetical protein